MLPHVQLILKLIDNSDNIDENLPLLKLLMSKQNIPSEVYYYHIIFCIPNDFMID